MALRAAAAAAILGRQILDRPSLTLPRVRIPTAQFRRRISCFSLKCAAEGGEGKKAPSRLAQVQQLMAEAQERSASAGNHPIPNITLVFRLMAEAQERSVYAGNHPIPNITLDHVTVNFARSGGPGGQNVNKVNTKVDMRFNVQKAHWLSERVRDKILQTEKNRINKDGELVISSTKTRTQKGNIDDALEKLQAIIDAASYVPPPPSQEQVKKIAKLAAIGERKRLESKKALSQKKSFRRSKDSWD